MGEDKDISMGGLLRLMALALIFGCLTMALVWKMGKLQERINELENAPADTVTVLKIDTVRVDTPVPVHHYIRLTDTITVCQTLNDTVKELIYLPREALVYKDTNYRAVVSGVQPRLDSIEVYQRTKTETITKTIKVPDRKRWGLGVHAGAGWNGREIQPYVGVGVQYNIVRW